jgi:hypothetical protein
MFACSPVGCLRTVDECGQILIGQSDLSGRTAIPSLRKAVGALRDFGTLLVGASPFGLQNTEDQSSVNKETITEVLKQLYAASHVPVDSIDGGDAAVSTGHLARVNGSYVVPLDGCSGAANWMIVLRFVASTLDDIVEQFRMIQNRLHAQPETAAIAKTLVMTVVRMLNSLQDTVPRIAGMDRIVRRAIDHDDPLRFARWSGDKFVWNEP